MEMKRCKDCKHNGDCHIQDAPPDMTKEQRENEKACELFEATE